jgi:hypothetical protein
VGNRIEKLQSSAIESIQGVDASALSLAQIEKLTWDITLKMAIFSFLDTCSCTIKTGSRRLLAKPFHLLHQKALKRARWSQVKNYLGQD